MSSPFERLEGLLRHLEEANQVLRFPGLIFANPPHGSSFSYYEDDPEGGTVSRFEVYPPGYKEAITVWPHGITHPRWRADAAELLDDFLWENGF